MATKKRAIGALIKLDGESAFRNSIANCRNSVGAMRAEMNNIIKSYDGSANSLQALTEMQAKYSEIQQRAHEQAEKMATAYDKSSEKQDEVKASMQAMKEAYVEAQKTLERMQESGTATAEAMAEQEEATETAYQNYLQYEAAVEKAESRTAYFQKALADAKGEEIEAGEAIKKYAAYIAEAQESTDGMASSIDGYGNEIRDIGESAEEGSVGVSMFTGALSANVVTAGLEKAIDVLKEGVEYAVHVGSAFEESQSKVKAISGATADEMAQIEAMSKNLGRTTKFSASEVSDGFSYMALAGFKCSEQLAAMPGVVNLAIAGEMDLAAASDMVTDYLSAFGLGAEYAGEMADMLAYAMSHSNANVEQFGEAWRNSAANMNAAGQSMQTTTAILEALANQGRKGSEAGTTLKAIMRDITSKMQEGAIAIGDTTVQVQDANGNFRDLIDILADVETATDGMGTAARAAALSSIFTDDSISGVNMALQEGVGAIRGYKDELNNCDGAASDMADTMNNNLSGSVKNLGSATEGLGNAVYSYLDGPVRGVVDGLTDAINGITDAIEPQVTEIDRFVDVVVEASDKIKNSISTVDIDYAESTAGAESLKSYLDVIEQARSKTSLTEFETYQLNSAIKSLSGSVPELNGYIDNTSEILGLSSEKFDRLKGLITTEYKATLADAIVSRRNALAQVMADEETEIAKAKSALDTSVSTFGESLSNAISDAKNVPLTPNLLSNMVGAFVSSQSAQDALSGGLTARTAKEQVADLSASYADVQAEFDALTEKLPEYRDELGITQDENGRWITSLKTSSDAAADAANATSDASNSIEDASGSIGDASQQMTDTVRTAAASYVSAIESMKNADPSDAIRDQLAAAAAEVQNFQTTIQSNLSGFSLFGDRSSLIEAYTTTNRDEMRVNMDWALSSMQTYTKELDELQRRGVSSDFIEYLTSQGQAGLNYVHSLALASDEELKQFQDSFTEYSSYITGLNDNVQHLMTDYAQTIANGIPEGKAAWNRYGVETVSGIFDGIDEAAAAIKNGSITGTIEDAIKVVLQNKADQIATQRAAQAAAREAQMSSARQTTGHTERYASNTKTPTQQDLRVTVDVSNPVYLDSKKIAEQNNKNARSRSKITGR